MADIAKSTSPTDRSDRDLHFDNVTFPKNLQIHPKTPFNHLKIDFQTLNPFFNHFPLPPPAPPPPTSTSHLEISFSGPDSSKSSVPYQKVSKSPPHPIFPRLANKLPE